MWKDEPSSNFLYDLRSFAMSLDYYELKFDLEDSKDKYVYLNNGKYEITSKCDDGAFKCPHCSSETFEVLEGEFQGKPALGLCCTNCNTYGAVFPSGM